MNFITNPKEIEQESMRIIRETMGETTRDPKEALVLERVIHTSADFDYVENLVFSPDAIAAAHAAMTKGATIVTDTKMAKSGINGKALADLGLKVECFIDDPEVKKGAQASGQTRSQWAVDHAFKTIQGPIIFVSGNAPTSLIRLHELINDEKIRPDLIVAVPVGFVNVVEAKELILGSAIPHIVAKGRKGGSNVAAAIINALMYQLVKRE